MRNQVTSVLILVKMMLDKQLMISRAGSRKITLNISKTHSKRVSHQLAARKRKSNNGLVNLMVSKIMRKVLWPFALSLSSAQKTSSSWILSDFMSSRI